MTSTVSPPRSEPAQREWRRSPPPPGGPTEFPVAGTPPSTLSIMATFLAVGLLAALDLLEAIPSAASIISTPVFVYLLEVHDLLALAIIFLAARSFGRRALTGLALVFVLLHGPALVLSIPDQIPEAVRTLFLSIGVIVGLGLTQRWREMETRMAGLALRDSVTGLPNSRQFYADLEHFLGETRRYGTTGAVLFLDLDKFKSINDRFGHRAGDEFLRTLGGWLRGSLRGTDWVARLGGDEFAALLTHVDALGAAVAAERVRATADLQEAVFEGHRLQSTASIGIARIPEDGTTLDEVLGRADAAMYRAKTRGGNRAEFYSD